MLAFQVTSTRNVSETGTLNQNRAPMRPGQNAATVTPALSAAKNRAA
jgi:hypothetical protein